jgi:hypothetical protein
MNFLINGFGFRESLGALLRMLPDIAELDFPNCMLNGTIIGDIMTNGGRTCIKGNDRVCSPPAGGGLCVLSNSRLR